MTRRELLLEETDPLRVDEPNFKIRLGPLVQLAKPIPSRRFTFLSTTGERLLEIQEINDLRVPPSKE